MIEIVWEKDNLPHRETIAMWDEHPYCSPVNPGRVPTEERTRSMPEDIYLLLLSGETSAEEAWRTVSREVVLCPLYPVR